MSDRHRISLPEALIMVQRARKSPPTLVKGWRIDGAFIKEILAQPGAHSLRTYLAATEDGVATLVYLGVDENGKDKVYSFDGLFVGNLLEDSAVATPSENTLRVEHFNSIVYQNANDRKWYFVAGAGGYASLWEIAGLDKITRFQAAVEVP